MKKLLFALFFLCMHYCVCAQQVNSQPDPVGLMENYLIENGEMEEGDLDCRKKIIVYELLSGFDLGLNTSELNVFIRGVDVGAFTFKAIPKIFDFIHYTGYWLLKSGDNYEMMPFFDYRGEVSKEDEFVWILNKFIDYLQRHPEIDDRLYPYYISLVSNIYFGNTDFLGGDWENWHGGEFADQDIPEKYKYGIDTKYSVYNLSMKDLTDIVNYHDYKRKIRIQKIMDR